MQMKIVKMMEVRYHKANNKIIVLGDKCKIYMKLFSKRRKDKYVVVCKVKDRKSNQLLYSKAYMFEQKIDLVQLKEEIKNGDLPKEFEELWQYM